MGFKRVHPLQNQSGVLQGHLKCRWFVGVLFEQADKPPEYQKFLEIGGWGKDLLSRRSFPQ